MYKKIIAVIVITLSCGSLLLIKTVNAQTVSNGAATSSDFFNMPAQSYFQNPSNQQVSNNISNSAGNVNLLKINPSGGLTVSGPLSTTSVVNTPSQSNWLAGFLIAIGLLMLLGIIVYVFSLEEAEVAAIAVKDDDFLAGTKTDHPTQPTEPSDQSTTAPTATKLSKKKKHHLKKHHR